MIPEGNPMSHALHARKQAKTEIALQVALWITWNLTFADGHTASNTPDLFRPPKLSGAGPGQYWGGGPPGKTLGCCQLLIPAVWLMHFPELTSYMWLNRFNASLNLALPSQRSLHNAPIFRLLLKVAVNGTHQCDFLNFCGGLGPQHTMYLRLAGWPAMCVLSFHVLIFLFNLKNFFFIESAADTDICCPIIEFTKEWK